jgi:hypothetical protein
MKAICIKEITMNSHNVPNLPAPKVGEEVTIIDSQKIDGIVHYQLQEYISYKISYKNYRLWYSCNNFSLLSDLDETELVTEEFEEKYCVPINR